MKKDIIILKKDIRAGGSILVRKGAFAKSSFIAKYPFMDITNREYFSETAADIIEPGTKVMYLGRKFYVIGIDDDAMGIKDGNPVDIRYTIGYQMNARDKETKKVYGSSLTVMEEYWFINSKGVVCRAYIGESSEADEWRRLTGNMFTNKEMANLERSKVWEKAK